ncbi:MAG: non-homologous end-joining DNA ligase [Acidimicrobiia bacterium]|nr:non-homologous end-joining DNA ligase [Acidimicrobiia bacterium]NND12423.1 ATP-dependent DNA ligase [Acidimicrobiia bacterium]NNL27240.1 ATP-dependent DNA ligase [Acidimicrobiia bacterium]
MKVSNADRVMFPEVGVTKGQVVSYYENAAGLMADFVVGRPLTLQRFPKGIAEKGFMQKNVAKHYPASIERYEVPKNEGGTTTYPVVRDVNDIAYLANQGTITFHVWLSTVEQPLKPDYLVLDLDPPEGSAEIVRAVALETRTVLDSFGVESIPVATGSKGFHVWIPLAGKPDFEQVSKASQALAGIIALKIPDQATLEFLKKERKGRVFVDWLRNHPGSTVAAPFSLRPRPRASLAMPITWDELESTAPDTWTIENVEDRLSDLPIWPKPVVLPIDQIVKTAEAAGVDLEARFDRFGRDRR